VSCAESQNYSDVLANSTGVAALNIQYDVETDVLTTSGTNGTDAR